ncbi:substrate-binding periplasmic protein [Aeromonas australiensis]|uniref:substrate-binding periplasmic protein n=1 Tax=Aeromonas australiensis TaxID=1114880 RepID=UPI00058A4629|nr:transporter substrate-binding domain-containing protein [Aeromonas australiensis]
MRVIPLFLLLFPLGLPARELVICGTLEPPLKFLDAGQRARGLDIEIVTTIFSALGVTTRIDLFDSGARLTRNAKTGACHIVMTHSHKAERESYLIYPQQAHIRHSWHFFVRKADLMKIRYETLADLKPWRIGLTRDYAYTPELTAIIQDPAYHIQEIPLNQLQLRKLLAGRIDTVPMPLLAAFAQIRDEGLEGKLDYLPKPLKSSPYFNTWARATADKDTPTQMAAYDAELLRMKRNGSLKALYDQHGIPYIEP